MNIIIERMDSIRFERTFNDGAKISFNVEHPKGLTLSNSQCFLDIGNYNTTIARVNHSWDSVFSNKTKIILVGKIKEIKSGGVIAMNYEGEFDLKELQKGNIVQITKNLTLTSEA